MTFCPTHTATPSARGHVKCRRCLNAERARHATLIRDGLCVSCMKPARQGKQDCKACAKRAHARYQKIRLEVLSHYCGGTPYCQCRSCRTTFIGFLQMDHRFGGGSKHLNARGVKVKGLQLLQWLKQNEYPEGFLVLCANCNGMGGKGTGTRCPMFGKTH